MTFTKCEFFAEDQNNIQKCVTEQAFKMPAADVFLSFKDNLKNDYIDGECGVIETTDLKKAYGKAAEICGSLEKYTTQFAMLQGMVMPTYVYINIALCDLDDENKEEVVVFSEGYQIGE